MCNLFENKTGFRDLVEAFGNFRPPIVKPGPEAAPNLPSLPSVRPTDWAPVVRAADGGAELVQMRWGFIPDRPKAGPITNFRSENRRFGAPTRCLVPATAFFEFTGAASPKVRWRFTEAGRPWFCLAGLWRPDPAPDGPGARFTLLTTAPGPDMAPYHDRQVVLLPARSGATGSAGRRRRTCCAPVPPGAWPWSATRRGATRPSLPCPCSAPCDAAP